MWPHTKHHKEKRESIPLGVKIEKIRILATFLAALGMICLLAQPAFALNIVTNNGMTVTGGSIGNIITQGMLETTDLEDGPSSITYTIVVPPANGTLKRSGGALGVGSTFTQQGINVGLITYDHDGSATTSDIFRFNVSDADLNIIPLQPFNITIINPPVLGGGGSTLNYTENDPATIIDSTLTVSDPNDTNLDSAAVTISTNYAAGEDQLVFTDTGTISGSYMGNVLTLTGSDTLANYQAALRSVQYLNTSDNPSTLDRTISWVVNDGISNSNTVTSTVTVAPVNDAPVVNPQGFNVDENSTNGTVVGSVAATDDEVPPQALSYAITAGNTGNAFAINSATGEITVATSSQLDFETNPAFSLTVEVTDDGTPNQSNTATITIDLNDLNEAPTANDGAVSIDENTANGTSVHTVVASDPDAGANGTLSYAITAGNTGSAFTINPASGEITVATSSQLNFETTPTFNLEVTVTDGGTPGLSDTATITITLTDVNDSPVVNPQTFNVDENSANGTVVGTVAATDDEAPPQTLSYAIAGGTGQTAFSINASSGEITVADSAQLDYETTSSFTLDVQVTDDGAPILFGTGTITINLNDITFGLTIQKAGTGDGTLVPDVGLHTYNDGEVVSLSATPAALPAPGSTFEGWSGDVSTVADPAAPNTTVTMNGDYVITATFDQTYQISVNDPSVVEGAIAQFTVTVTPAIVSGDTVTVNYDSSGVTATEGSDFTSVDGGSLTFTDVAPNPQTINVTTNQDTDAEPDETFTLDLTSPSANVALIDNQGDGTIQDDDNYSVLIQSVTPFPVTEGAAPGTVTFTVALTNVDPVLGIIDPVTVQYATVDGTAVDGMDYIGASNTLTFSGMTTSQDVTISIQDDSLFEGAESFDLTLSNFSGTLAGSIINGTETATILDDGDSYSVSIEAAKNVTEGAAPGTVAFTVTLDQQVPGGAAVNFATSDGSAVAGAPGSGDYESTSGTLNFLPTETSKDIVATINNDTVYEGPETFDVDITTLDPNANITASKGVCTITDDADKYGVAIEAAKTVKEGAAPGTVILTVTLDQQVPGGAAVNFATSDGSAVAGAPGSGDYESASGTLNFLPTETSKDIAITVNNDYLDENDETFDVDITSADPAADITASKGICTLTDNDHTLTLTKTGTGAAVSTAAASDGDKTGLPGGAADGAFVYEEGDVVTLTATDTYPGQGTLFKGWSGDASGTNYVTTVTVDAPKTITADFNATYTFAIREAGTGLVQSTVTSGLGGDGARFPGGMADGNYLYEEGDTVSLMATDSTPDAGSEFQDWTVNSGNPGAGFSLTAKSTAVTISGDLQITGNFRGTWKITAIARAGGQIDPLGITTGYYGVDQPYAIVANVDWVNSDVVVDGVSQGPTGTYSFSNIMGDHTITAVFTPGNDPYIGPPAGDDQIFQASVPPLVLLVMGRNHKLYYEAYNDASDLNGDGTLDVGYNPNIDYYGYFDSRKVYKYDSSSNRFYPVRRTTNKKVDAAASDEWSGDFLNYLTMSRMDVLRKVLYGGSRSLDTDTATVLERVYIPQDAHSWGKEYESPARDGYDIQEYTPLGLPEPGTRHLFASTTLEDGTTGNPDLGRPLLRVLPYNTHRIWEWVAKERPVVDNSVEHAGITGGTHPGHPQNHDEFEDLVLRYATAGNYQCTQDVALIDGSGNPCSGFSEDNFLTVFTGDLYVDQAGWYRFAVDGNDAVEVLLDGNLLAGWYDGHVECACQTHESAPIYLTKGVYDLEFRHEEGSGTETYHLWWNGPDSGDIWEIVPTAGFYGAVCDLADLDTGGFCADSLRQHVYTLLTKDTPGSYIVDYEVKVEVCNNGLEEANCKQYPSGNYKPTGILQKYGEPGRLYFGLLTGSYTKNNSGGVLRKPIGSIVDEIEPATGRFMYKYDSSVEGIVKTIDRLRVMGFHYTGGTGSDYSYIDNCGWITDRPINQGECRMWGNPIGEMMYEGMRYFAGKGAPLAAFTYDTTASLDDNVLGLPKPAWDDPYQTHDYCSKPFMLVLSDIYPTYDSDQLPNSYFELNDNPGTHYSAGIEDLAGLDVDALADMILTNEGDTGSHYIGQVQSSYDGSCLPKNMAGFGDVRGLCPEEPTKQGSYYAAGVAYHGRTQDINPVEGEQNVVSYMVGLASPFPRINIKVGTKNITLIPFGKSVYWSSNRILPDYGAFQPTNTIVDFFVEDIDHTYGRFRINFEDVEQGADHDMDAIVVYEYQVIDAGGNPVSDPADGTGVKITLTSEYAAGGIIQHIGYVVSGTTQDGTYLEVRDSDTASGSDVDYFLDTPPGVLPATASDWDDDAPLPLTAVRTFSPGTTASATLLKNPLWYAAKWGGFNDINEDDMPDAANEWDENGDGQPDTYFYVVNPLKLEQRLNQSFADIISRGVSYVAPVVSVDQSNRTQSGDELYMPFFKPLPNNYWRGNLKKYGLDYLSRDECGRPNQEWTVVDKDGNVAGDCDGTFKSTTTSFWSTTSDGGYVDRGGAGERLKDSMPGLDPFQVPASGPYYDFRNIYAYKSGALVRFDRANITNGDLDVATDLDRYRIINYIYGYTFDADASSGDPKGKREWILGDIIHSQPRVIDYLDETGNLERRYIAIGSNDGMLHVFTDTDIPSLGRSAGDEIFAFVPADLLIRLKEVSSTNTHIYLVDGSPNLFVSPTFDDGNSNGLRDAGEYYEKTLVFGERRGGRSYWALDVTEPDPSLWSVKWYIEGGFGGTAGFEELGYSWSKPFFTTIRTAADTLEDVVIFSAGYDPLEDGYPEGFDDANENGIRDFTDTNSNGTWDPGEPGETFAVTVGGTEGHDKWNPGMDQMGRGLYVVDLDDGSVLFKATHGDTDVTTGTAQSYTAMQYCFPADISVIPLSEEYLLMYAADIYGQIWKITYDYFAAGSNKWAVKRIFMANPGSDLPSGTSALADISTASLDATDAGRKTFYSPDISFGNDWALGLPVLYFGTGDREHPTYRMISNRLYAVTDADSSADETDLLNLTCDELDRNADADGDGDFDTDDVDIQNTLANLLYDYENNGLRGLYRVLDRQGDCADDDFDHTGEQVLSQPTLFFKNVFFTSYQAEFGDPCNPQGNAFIYALDYSYFTAALNFLRGNDADYLETRDIRDTYRVITGSSIPSGVSIITRDGEAAGLISAGGGLVGAGEEGSTSIPGPPAGVSPILWETE
jgi:Tfp pilus tip-associated adhesin PilY1